MAKYLDLSADLKMSVSDFFDVGPKKEITEPETKTDEIAEGCKVKIKKIREPYMNLEDIDDSFSEKIGTVMKTARWFMSGHGYAYGATLDITGEDTVLALNWLEIV